LKYWQYFKKGEKMQYNEFKRKIKLLNKEEIEFINKLSLEDVIAFLKTIGE